MTLKQKPTGLSALAALASIAALTSCGTKYTETPKSICGTKVTKALIQPLLRRSGKVSEWHSAGWGEPGSAWCIVSVGNDRTLRFQFSWHPDSIDPLKFASPDDSVTGLRDPSRMHLADSAAIGDNGAIATTRCKSGKGDHFTIALRLTQKGSAPHLRSEVAKFMRSYMPTTMQTVGCTHP
ncbi:MULTISPECIES: hypothetical protein [unclassified Streptomyces]|uniref:hypothetical protein n=1 Tax=unclassified Streptomyces TaxID=2593676 RepID=UPI0033E3FFB0